MEPSRLNIHHNTGTCSYLPTLSNHTARTNGQPIHQQMTRAYVMRTLLPSTRLLFNASSGAKLRAVPSALTIAAGGCSQAASCRRDCRYFAQVQDVDKLNREVWFTSGAPRASNDPGKLSDHKPPDERTLQLGKTVRILHESLPTLLQTPLPSDILSPRITLHLFPSTHPHLPTVSGRLAYIAALWTAPVAWGRVPLVGNVKLSILSERMVRNGGSAVPLASREEKLIVKWKTCGKTKHRDGTGGIYRGLGIGARDPVDRIREFIAGTKDGDRERGEAPEEFCGIFIFEFDDQGRIAKHVIEHTEQGGSWDKMTRVVSVTDWLLGHINGKRQEDVPALAFCEERPSGTGVRIMDRSQRAQRWV